MPLARSVARVALITFGAQVILGSELFAGGMGSYRRTEVTTSAETGRTVTIIPSKEEDEKVRRTAEALDRLRNKVEEWGAVTISAPVAVLDSRAFFVPPNIVDAKVLYKDAAKDINASAIQSLEVGASNQLGVEAKPILSPPSKLRPSPAGAAGSPEATSASAPTQSAAPDTSEATAPSPASLGALSSEKAAAPFALQTTPTEIVKSVSARLREAEDNAMKQKIYSEMSIPMDIEKHSHVIFAIVQVSCNPGWRTQQKYIADCSASVEYYDMLTHMHYGRENQRAPTVFSVLPLMDAQTVEMANSQREVTQLAFQLAGSLPAKGVNIKAKDIFNFVRRYSRDLKSVTPIPVVNSYSTGKTFGFRFSPSFQALRDPAQKNSRAANVLLPTTFPALITVIIHDADLRAYGEWYHQKHLEWLPAEHVDDGKLPPGAALLTHISTRWYLKERPPLWQFPKRVFTPMKRDTARTEVYAAHDVAMMNDVNSNTFPEQETYVGTFNPVYEELHREVIDLQSKGVGQSWPVSLDNAFLEAKKERDAKIRARLDQMKLVDERIEDTEKEVRELNAQRELAQLKKKMKESPPGEKLSIDEINPTDVTLDATEVEVKLTVSGTGLETVKSAELGKVKTTDVKPKDGALNVSFQLPSAKDKDKLKSDLEDEDQLDLKLLDAQGGVVAVEEEAITVHLKEMPANPSGSGEKGNKSPQSSTTTPGAPSTSDVTPDGTAIAKLDVKKFP